MQPGLRYQRWDLGEAQHMAQHSKQQLRVHGASIPFFFASAATRQVKSKRVSRMFQAARLKFAITAGHCEIIAFSGMGPV